jgi:hypothetical protein
MFSTAITAIGMAVAAATGCAAPAPTTTPAAPVTAMPAAKPPCVGDIVTVIGFDTPTDCDVIPPQRLDINAVTVAQCEWMGGTVRTVDQPMDGLVNCEGVDY